MLWIMTKDGWKQFECPAIKNTNVDYKMPEFRCYQNRGYRSFEEWMRRTV